MTEEIIIDCAFYKDGVCASPINKTCEYCKNIDVSKCYHKQLKRLEQENEKLKKQYNCYACDTCNGKEDYRNMKRHCENAIKTVHKYSSVLNEIRKIAEDVEDASSIRFYRIKRKINEVLNDT